MDRLDTLYSRKVWGRKWALVHAHLTVHIHNTTALTPFGGLGAVWRGGGRLRCVYQQNWVKMGSKLANVY